MEQKFINYLTTIILSILFLIKTIEMHSYRPTKFPIATASGRPLKAHPGSCCMGSELSNSLFHILIYFYYLYVLLQ